MQHSNKDGRTLLAQGAQWYASLSERQRVITNVGAEQISSLRQMIANQARQEERIKVR